MIIYFWYSLYKSTASWKWLELAFLLQCNTQQESIICKWTEPTFVHENFTLSLRGNDTVITRVKAVFNMAYE